MLESAEDLIDRLTAERDDYAKAADFLELEMAKFQIAADEAKAERDAAVAEINFLRNENFQQRCEIRELIERIE